ncbi:MAG: GT4 family glycosyltransferase PelF [Clostridia bacterium]
MKICLLCEGCYPYVVGGVSSWVQQLIKNFPQYEFSIYAIAADSSQKGDFKFELPENCTSVQEIFLNDAFIADTFEKKSETSVKPWEINEFKKLFLADLDKWDSIFEFFNRGKHIVISFLTSREFYDIVYEVYMKQYSLTIFTDFLWTMRSMYLTLFHIFNNPPERADLFHCVSTGYGGIAGSLAKRIYGSGLVITEHGIYTREREEEIIKAEWVSEDFKPLWINYFKSLSKGAYNSADRIIALFDTNSKIQNENGADKLKCAVIPNGINVSLFQNLPGKTAEDSGFINVGAVIRVSPIKDIKTMLYAFDAVKNRLPNARFYIMGPTDEAPEYYEECLSILKEMGTADIVFMGRVNVRDQIGRMDVMVLTSISEAQPLALMEAMAAGIPCVSTNVGCCNELFNGSKDRL